jgi:hypothetical protein
MEQQTLQDSPSEPSLSTPTKEGPVIASSAGSQSSLDQPPVPYKLYKRRFAGCLGVVSDNHVTALSSLRMRPRITVSVECGDRYKWSLVRAHFI